MALRFKRCEGDSRDWVEDVESSEDADGDCIAASHCKQRHEAGGARTESEEEEESGGGSEMVEIEELVE